jgi:hypothetical protein
MASQNEDERGCLEVKGTKCPTDITTGSLALAGFSECSVPV